MSELWQAFLLGNGAILTNVCLLPLYPGLIAFLAGSGPTSRYSAWLGAFVLAGILSMMTLVGLLLYLVQASFHQLLPWFLPLTYTLVIALGLLMLFGFNPFMKLRTLQLPILKNPFATAFAYGLLLAPMTLPCTGPIILSAFLLGAGSLAVIGDGLLYFLAFGLGFGWPLVILPLLALPWQQRATRWLSHRHQLLSRAAGLILVGIGLFGFWTEILPNMMAYTLISYLL